MSKIAALDEITEQLGPPGSLVGLNMLGNKTAEVARLRHRGAVINLSVSPGISALSFD
jgi:hypothetical protein